MDYVVRDGILEQKNTGASISAPVTEKPVYEGYMNAQAQPEQVETPTPIETVEQVEVKPYTFRKLNSTDLFPMIKIISKIGLDELTEALDGNVISKLLDKAKKTVDEDAEQTEQTEQTEQSEEVSDSVGLLVGVGAALKLANKILEHLPSCETEIYTLLSRVSGMTVDKVKLLDLDVFLNMIVDFIQKEEFKSFFKVASKFVK